ncbi:MAG: helicase SNF2, partial [Sphingobacteriia bacterium]
MALPYLVKHIYNNGTEEVIRRGKKIHALGNAELIEQDDLMGNIVFRVKDDGYATFYKVHINQYKDPKTISLRCTCPYNLSEICRHKAGALFHLQDLLDKNLLGDKETVYDQKHTVVKIKLLDIKLLRLLTSTATFEKVDEYLRSNKATILEAKNEKVVAVVAIEDEQYKVVLQKNEERNFDTSCTCNSETEHPLCLHKGIVFLQLFKNYGAAYFDSIRNWDKEKNKLLALYGYALTDDIKGKFEFTYTDGKPFLRVLDTTIKRVGLNTNTNTKSNALSDIAASEKTIEASVASLKMGLVITALPTQYPNIQLEAVQGETDDGVTKYISKTVKLDLTKFVNTEVFSEDDKMLLQQLRKLMPAEVSRYLNRNSPFSGIWENIIQQNNDELPDETKHLINEYLHPKIKKLFSELSGAPFIYYLPSGKIFTTANLQEATLSDHFISPEFEISYHQNQYIIDCRVKLPLADLNITENACESPIVFQYLQQFFTWKKSEDILQLEKFLPTGKMIIDELNWAQKLQEFILPLSKEYAVHFTNVKKEEIRDSRPELKILLKEKGEYLLFHPIFNYRGYDITNTDKEKIFFPVADQLLVIHRNMAVERELMQRIESLHSGFVRPIESNMLALKGKEVLKNNWFFLFIDAVKEMNIPVFGFEALKNFRFNTAKPSTKIFISSNTD